MHAAPKILDAVVIGAGPSGLGASLALSGWRAHYNPACINPDEALESRLKNSVVVPATDRAIELLVQMSRKAGREYEVDGLGFNPNAGYTPDSPHIHGTFSLATPAFVR